MHRMATSCSMMHQKRNNSDLLFAEIYMRKIKLIFLCITCYLTALHVYAKELQYISDGRIYYYCNDKKSNFYFSAEQQGSFLKDFKEYNIDVDSLLISKEDSEGNITRLGSKKSIHQCGAIKLVVESGFYNANTQGMLGLLDYPLMSISINGKRVFDKNPLNLCASSGSRAICPTDFSVQSIEIIKVSRDLYQVTFTKALPVNNGDSFKLKKEIIKLKAK